MANRRILNYRTESTARGVLKRLLKRYPHVSADSVKIVPSTLWQFPFRYLLQVTAPNGKQAYWSAEA